MNASVITGLRSEVVVSLIGHTPLVPLRFEPEGLTIYTKCEFLNLGGSIKDRLAKTVFQHAAVQGRRRKKLTGNNFINK